jgi:hypothetical protein
MGMTKPPGPAVADTMKTNEGLVPQTSMRGISASSLRAFRQNMHDLLTGNLRPVKSVAAPAPEPLIAVSPDLGPIPAIPVRWLPGRAATASHR